MGHSSTAYQAAKERLERKYGGRRRQIAIYIEELDQFPQVRPGSALDLEKFADLLDIAIINLQECGQHQELGGGSLYTNLQRKLPEAMLARYHRWKYENKKPESVVVLRTWVIQESEFLTIASETVHGLTGKMAYDTPATPAVEYRDQRTFFGDTSASRSVQKLSCKVCGKKHGVWSCADFIQKSVPDRWNIAKQFQLCFRCLAVGHHGKSCPRSRQCGLNECQQLHHTLLHKSESRLPQLHSQNDTQVNRTGGIKTDDLPPESARMAIDRIVPVTEGNAQTTMMTQEQITAFIGLRTVPVILINGDRCRTVNALLDDASTKTYVNADVAAKLGLTGQSEQVTVNVLNGQARTFESKPVNIELKSVKGDVRMKVSAYTTTWVTGNMAVADWNSYKIRWPHLRNIDFPRSETRPMVDILIGLDCADLHCALQEVRGRAGNQ